MKSHDSILSSLYAGLSGAEIRIVVLSISSLQIRKSPDQGKDRSHKRPICLNGFYFTHLLPFVLLVHRRHCVSSCSFVWQIEYIYLHTYYTIYQPNKVGTTSSEEESRSETTKQSEEGTTKDRKEEGTTKSP